MLFLMQLLSSLLHSVSQCLRAGEHQGVLVAKDPATDGYSARLLAIARDNDFVFTYYTEGRYHFEVPGIAKRVGSSSGLLGGDSVCKRITSND